MDKFFNSKSGKKTMGIAYGLGAAVVILGALFKILHWPFANEMLIIGMGTEALIFCISAFEPIHEDWDWSLVYPELAGIGGASHKTTQDSGLSTSQQLDKMLEDAKIGPELIQGLGTGLQSLSTNVASMADLSGATVATKEYAENVSKANVQLTEMGSSYSRAVNALEGLAATTDTFKETADRVISLNNTLGNDLMEFDQNIQSLNKVYGGMLSAMRPNN